MAIPDDFLFYCGLCIFIVVLFCCCFHVTELIKLGYLRKLTSPHRYSMGGVSNADLFDSGSGSSTRRNTAIVNPSDTSTASFNGDDAGNFSIITVFTYSSTSQRKVTQDLHHRSRVEIHSEKNCTRETLSKELFHSTVHKTEESIRENPMAMISLENVHEANIADRNVKHSKEENHSGNSKDFIDEPPTYNTLFPKL